jgi:hypothetical protein
MDLEMGAKYQTASA